MSLEKRRIVRRSVGIVLATLLVVTGAMLIASCVRLYSSGPAPFTRESVGAALLQLAVPLVLSVAGVVVAGVLALIFPAEEVKLRAKISEEVTLAHLANKEGLNEAARSEERVRFVLRVAVIVMLAGALTVSLCYVLNDAHYVVGSYNDIVLDAVLWTLLPFGAVGALAVVASYLCRASVKRELALLRGEGEKHPQTVRKCPLCGFLSTHKKQVKFALRCGISVIAIVFVIIGILNGGMADVLGKAINICTECIGLG
jgi:hypothetical protein